MNRHFQCSILYPNESIAHFPSVDWELHDVEVRQLRSTVRLRHQILLPKARVEQVLTSAYLETNNWKYKVIAEIDPL